MTNSVLRWAAAAAALPALAFAQLVTNVVPRQRTVPVQESIDSAISSAQWQLGGLRLQPRVGVREMGYNNNVYGTDEDAAVEDWTATIFGGIKAYLPLGAKGALSSSLLPEYTWYDDLDYRRHFGGFYDVSAYAFFNRLTLEATAFANDAQGIVNSERETQAILDAQGGTAKFELEIFRRLALFGGVDARDVAYEDPSRIDDPELRFSELDRTESAARGGIRYRWSSFLDVSVLQETTTTEFEVRPLESDNESEALLIGIHYDRPKFFLNITGGSRDGKPVNGSTFPAYTETTGSWFAEYRLTAPIDVQAFGSRDVVYGLFADNPYFLESRRGISIRWQAGQRLAVMLSAEDGENDYPIATESEGRLAERRDAVATRTASLSIPLGRAFAVTLGASQSDYNSNIPGYDRSVLRWISTIGLRRAAFLR